MDNDNKQRTQQLNVQETADKIYKLDRYNDAVEIAKALGSHYTAEKLLRAQLSYSLEKADIGRAISDIAYVPKDVILDAFDPESPFLKGYKTRFSRWANGNVVFRPRELSLWVGINGHGKSLLLNQVMLDLIETGAKVCIASLEMHRRLMIRRTFRQASGLRIPSNGYLMAIQEHYSSKLFFYDHVGSLSQERLLDDFKAAREFYGVDVFVIDSLMKCGIDEDDYNAQKRFIDVLCNFKEEMQCQIHLVAHPRKGMDEKDVPGKLDIKGTGTISDLADNVFSVWRNKQKEEALDREPNDIEQIEKPDAMLRCIKQRNGEYEGAVPLWFDKESLQYLNFRAARVHCYVPYSQKGDELEYLRSI